jgi:outer membrane protein OmpA-like peptidoglycan-associated protein
MGERALAAPLEDTDVARGEGRRDRESTPDSPAIRLLDALRAGDDAGVIAVCGDATIVSAENMAWSCRGRDEIQQVLVETRRRFPGLTFESRTRHIGFGLVIDEARVQDDSVRQDDTAEGAAPTADETPAPTHRGDPDVHPMWDEPVTEQRNVMSVWRGGGTPGEPTPLNMPVRVTVRHDDLQVHEVMLSFPAALLKRALGLPVDPLEISLSEVQSAFIAPVGAGFTTYQLARPELKVAPPPPAELEPAHGGEPPRRRRRWSVPVLLAVIAVVAAGGWWAVQGRDGSTTAGPSAPASSAPTTPAKISPTASSSPDASASSSQAPKITHAKPSNVPSHKPNITLKSDLAFGFNSSKLSSEAKHRIDQVAQQVRDNKLSGTIYVDGYTDNLGSNAYGLVLSQRRADAVSQYLGSQLVGVTGVSITSTGHGEANPIASNATEAGRVANRRVTITLPKP